MEEKTLIQGFEYNFKKFAKILFISSIALIVILFVGSFIITFITNSSELESHFPADADDKYFFEDYTYDCVHIQIKRDRGYNYFSGELDYESFNKAHPDAASFIECAQPDLAYLDDTVAISILFLLVPIAILSLIALLIPSKFSFIITNKGVYVKAIFGRRIHLPLDKITSVGTSFLKGISVGTPSRKIHFKLIKNNVDVYNVLTNLLIERQSAQSQACYQQPASVEQPESQVTADTSK